MIYNVYNKNLYTETRSQTETKPAYWSKYKKKKNTTGLKLNLLASHFMLSSMAYWFKDVSEPHKAIVFCSVPVN